MINENNAKRYCCEDISLIENYSSAISDKDEMWECHHRREREMRQKDLKDIGEYYERPACELIFLPTTEHRRLIAGLPKSEEHKKNISKGRMGMKFSEDHKRNLSMSHIGNTWSEEQKQKFINSRKGERWFNNGVINVRRKECPDGFTPGRLKTEQNGK